MLEGSNRRRKVPHLHGTIARQVIRQDVIRIGGRYFVENRKSALVIVRTECSDGLVHPGLNVDAAQRSLLSGRQTRDHKQRGADTATDKRLLGGRNRPPCIVCG